MNIDLTDFNKNICSTEVSKMDWLSYENACSLIRPYNLEKLSILNKVNTILIQFIRFIAGFNYFLLNLKHNFNLKTNSYEN